MVVNEKIHHLPCISTRSSKERRARMIFIYYTVT